MKTDDLAWMAPWREVADASEAAGLERQLVREIGRRHPLRGKALKVVGRRIDCDDIVALTPDGTYYNVHLTWADGGWRQRLSRDYPSWFEYGPTRAFAAAMAKDAVAYARGSPAVRAGGRPTPRSIS